MTAHVVTLTLFPMLNLFIWVSVFGATLLQMDFNLDHYNSSPLRRTLEEMTKMSQKKGTQDKYSCEHEPLLKIELVHVVLDELHLLLRITDVLINNLVKQDSHI